MKKVFELSPVLCVKCGGVMVLTALIQDDAGQADPNSEQWDARQDWPAGDWPA